MPLLMEKNISTVMYFLSWN